MKTELNGNRARAEASQDEPSEVRRHKVSGLGQRLRWIEMRLRFLGEIRRSDLIDQFGVNTITASRDLAEYRKLYPENMLSEKGGKSNRRAPSFAARYSFTPDEVLESLTTCEVLQSTCTAAPALKSLRPPALNGPSLDALAAVTEGLYRGLAVEISYSSLSSGESKRELVPYMLATDGVRWHVRGFDRKKSIFGDFVLSRIRAARLTDSPARDGERQDDDKQWGLVDLEIVPKPSLKHPKTIEREYGMEHGVLRIRMRAALVGYVLRRLNVDCTPDARLSGGEYHLWLRNRHSLLNVDNLGIAPGYSTPEARLAPKQD
jgi:predicted DNA-binding transcriptional regulator YafY